MGTKKSWAFAIGEIVQLKSGGPKMTVHDYDDYSGTIQCVWFAGAKKENGHFKPEALVAVAEAKPNAKES